jgi:hypothetical protein
MMTDREVIADWIIEEMVLDPGVGLTPGASLACIRHHIMRGLGYRAPDAVYTSPDEHDAVLLARLPVEFNSGDVWPLLRALLRRVEALEDRLVHDEVAPG